MTIWLAGSGLTTVWQFFPLFPLPNLLLKNCPLSISSHYRIQKVPPLVPTDLSSWHSCCLSRCQPRAPQLPDIPLYEVMIMGPRSSWWTRIFGGLIGIGLLLGPPAAAVAGSASLSWDPNTEQDFAGYQLYYGPSSGSYQFTVDVGNQTTYTLSGLTDGQTYSHHQPFPSLAPLKLKITIKEGKA
jgi:hypothetical protein